jgi:hypothetical protein
MKKAPKFVKELTFLFPYIFDEETRKQNISSRQLYHRMNREMTVRIATVRLVISDTARRNITDTTAPSSSHNFTDCVQTDEKELIHPKYLMQHPFFKNIYGQKGRIWHPVKTH